MTKETAKTEQKKIKPAKTDGSIEQNKSKEVGGPTGPEPTRYGDWERGGRCVDF